MLCYYKTIKWGDIMIDLDGVKRDVVNKGIAALGDVVFKIILFGSYARGDFEEDSDVDIMVLLNCARNELPRYRKKLSVVSSDASLDNNVTVSLMVNDKNTFYNMMDIQPFYQNVQKDGVVLYEQC